MPDQKKQRVYTDGNGRPIENPKASQRVGSNGPLLLQDFHLIDLLAHFDRERIPERVVHAKGAGAYGFFELTDPVDDLTSNPMFRHVGQKTKLVCRFSTVGGEKGSADSARDPRGFALKFYTDEGNWDWVFNNTPIFFLRDPSKFPMFIHTQKRHPQTNLKDTNMFWDYLSSNQECVHQVMHLFSDRGTPYSYRHMNAYSGHTFKWTKPDGTYNYVQIHCKTDQGNKTFTAEEAAKMESANPDWHTEDLFNSIKKGEYPSWTCYVQVLSPEQVEKFRWNIFDLTKVWPQKEVPLRRFGRFTLNKNPENYFSEIEQAAFSPSHLVPGVEPSADPVLQARLFSYPDTHRHRLGTNYQQIPVNKPLNAFNPFQRDGAMTVTDNYGSLPHYPSTSEPNLYTTVKPTQAKETWHGAAEVVALPVTDEDYVQPRALWGVLGRTPGQQEHLVSNIAGHLCGADKRIREATYGMFTRVHQDLGARLRQETEAKVPISARL
ncbi:catalase isozyme P [Stachybotrys elegans]|uniref:Catalase n=1 Tax=Stachybotrys elegans TaxID=80388 RepID=A0A8K0SSR8_9HYPO|nr:catalase isozyme P [Stachybotrys elegans]